MSFPRTLAAALSITASATALGLFSGPTAAQASRSIQCHGNDITISQDDAHVSLTGDCGTVRVTGDDAVVHIESADAVFVSGDSVQIRSEDDLDSLTIDADGVDADVGDVDHLAIDGHHNHVDADSVDSIDIDGNDNRVTWHGAKPQLDITGQRNTASAR